MQLNKKLMEMERKMAQLNEGSMIAISELDLFKQVAAKQFEELTARVESQHQDKLEQSGYDLNIGQEREMLSKQFAEELEARHREQLAHVFHEMERLRQDIAHKSSIVQQSQQPPAVQGLDDVSNQLREYVDNSLRQREPRML